MSGGTHGRKWNWTLVTQAFVDGVQEDGSDERLYLSLTEISERYNIPLQTIRARSSQYNWFAQREEAQRRLIRSMQNRRVLELGGQSVDFDGKTLRLAQRSIDILTHRIDEIAQDITDQQVRREAALATLAEGGEVNANDLRSVVPVRELEVMSRAVLQWQQVGQRAMGTDVQRLDVQQEIQVEADVVSVTTELGRDDPDRLAGFLQAAKRAGLLDQFTGQSAAPVGQIEAVPVADGEIIDGEIVA